MSPVKPKTIIVGALLIGVATAVFAQIIREWRGKPAAAPAGTDRLSNPSPVASAPHKVIAYYFHRTVRCETCRAIETQARAALEAEFFNALNSGLLEWHAINIEEAGNEHFAKDYDLTTSALVLVDLFDDRQARWTKLDRVWELVHTPPAFAQYVQNEVHSYLEGR
jgi:hypothetical protein